MRLGHSAFHAAISRVSERQEFMVDVSWLVGERPSSSIRIPMPTWSARHRIKPGDSKAWVKIVLGTAVGSRAAVSLGSVSVGSAAAAGGGIASRLEPDSPPEALASGCRVGVSGIADGAGVSSLPIPG